MNLRPVRLALLPDRVADGADALGALRLACEACEAMANQANDVRNTYGLRVALLGHLFTVTLPFPRPLRARAPSTRRAARGAPSCAPARAARAPRARASCERRAVDREGKAGEISVALLVLVLLFILVV